MFLIVANIEHFTPLWTGYCRADPACADDFRSQWCRLWREGQTGEQMHLILSHFVTLRLERWWIVNRKSYIRICHGNEKIHFLNYLCFRSDILSFSLLRGRELTGSRRRESLGSLKCHKNSSFSQDAFSNALYSSQPKDSEFTVMQK